VFPRQNFKILPLFKLNYFKTFFITFKAVNI